MLFQYPLLVLPPSLSMLVQILGVLGFGESSSVVRMAVLTFILQAK